MVLQQIWRDYFLYISANYHILKGRQMRTMIAFSYRCVIYEISLVQLHTETETEGNSWLGFVQQLKKNSLPVLSKLNNLQVKLCLFNHYNKKAEPSRAEKIKLLQKCQKLQILKLASRLASTPHLKHLFTVEMFTASCKNWFSLMSFKQTNNILSWCLFMMSV